MERERIKLVLAELCSSDVCLPARTRLPPGTKGGPYSPLQSIRTAPIHLLLPYYACFHTLLEECSFNNTAFLLFKTSSQPSFQFFFPAAVRKWGDPELTPQAGCNLHPPSRGFFNDEPNRGHSEGPVQRNYLSMISRQCR